MKDVAKVMSCKKSGPDIEGLKRFASPVSTIDRGGTPFFAGRHQEIEDVELTIDGVMERFRDRKRMPAGDVTWLFQGPPGVGKSALLAQLDERWSSKENKSSPVSLPIPAEIIYNRAHLVAKIADVVAKTNNDTETADKLRQIVSIDHITSASVGGEFFLKASTQSSEHKSVATNPRELTWETLANLFPLEMWERPVVLMLDEVQSLRNRDAPSELLNLHQGIHGLPIIPIFAGLSDSYDVLRKQNISRMAHRHRVTLGALEHSEAEDAVKKMLDTFRVEGSNKAAWADRIAVECSCWPQHLQTGLQALAKVLSVHEGKLGSIEGEFANAVSELSETYRNEYYEDRLDDDLAGCLGLLCIVLDSARPPGKSLAKFKRIIADRADNSGAPEYQLPDGFNAAMLLDRMIKRGFLQLSKTGRRYICPIPSLTDYIYELIDD